jgi:hypothetical protein
VLVSQTGLYKKSIGEKDAANVVLQVRILVDRTI